MSITIIICEVETMKEPLVITMAREYASGGSEIAQKVADLLGIPLYNKELITIAAKKSGPDGRSHWPPARPSAAAA